MSLYNIVFTNDKKRLQRQVNERNPQRAIKTLRMTYPNAHIIQVWKRVAVRAHDAPPLIDEDNGRRINL